MLWKSIQSTNSKIVWHLGKIVDVGVTVLYLTFPKQGDRAEQNNVRTYLNCLKWCNVRSFQYYFFLKQTHGQIFIFTFSAQCSLYTPWYSQCSFLISRSCIICTHVMILLMAKTRQNNYYGLLI